jgi:hypothetical protein
MLWSCRGHGSGPGTRDSGPRTQDSRLISHCPFGHCPFGL